jgi:hypothetical protein
MATIPGAAAQHVTITDDCRRNRTSSTALAVALDKLDRAAHQAFNGWPIGTGAKLHLALVVERPPAPEPEPEAPPRVTDPRQVVNALLLTDVCMESPIGQTDVAALARAVDLWTDDQRAAAFEWAAIEHLHASDNDDVKRVPCPPHVQVLRGEEWRKNRGR